MDLQVSPSKPRYKPFTMDSAHYTLKATVAHTCHISRGLNSSNTRHPNPGEGNSTLWRPWLFSSRDRASAQQKLGSVTDTDNANPGKKGALGFQHPVRLYMPKSKTEEYLQHMGEKVLANFPVQATIHFYNDDSESEEEEEDDYEMDYNNYYQNYKNFPGREAENIVEEDSYSSGNKQDTM